MSFLSKYRRAQLWVLLSFPNLADDPILSPFRDLHNREAQLSQYDIAVLTQSGWSRGFQRCITEVGKEAGHFNLSRLRMFQVDNQMIGGNLRVVEQLLHEVDWPSRDAPILQ